MVVRCACSLARTALMGVSLCGTYYSAVMLDFYRIGIISAHTVVGFLFPPEPIARRESVLDANDANNNEVTITIQY